MTGFTRIASALASITASTGVFLGTTVALASPAPARLVAQTTVPIQQPASPSQAHFLKSIETYGIAVGGDRDAAASEGSVSVADPACIAGCQPWLTLDQRF